MESECDGVNIIEEIWRPIPNYDGYEVSNYGRVRSIEREIPIISKNGKQFMRKMKGKELRQSFDGKRNYLHVSLGNASINVHRIVANVFIPNPNNLPEVNHKDENKTNNRADNLEWCNRAYNNNYGSLNGKIRGEGNPKSKFSEDVVREIKASYITNDKEYGIAGLARKYGVSQTHVCAITKGRRWGWLS